VGLLGYGAVGREVAETINRDPAGAGRAAEIVGALVRDPARYGEAARQHRIRFVDTADALLELRPDLVVEAAGHAGFREHVPAILAAGVEVLALSVGALADGATHAAVTAAAEQGGGRLRVASGAIAGLDAISAAAVGRIDRVTHVVRKPPMSLLDPDEAAALVASGRPAELFAGPAREAALLFPANVNVIAAVSLAGIGLDRTEARVIADPAVSLNTHEVTVEGEFGRLFLRIENEPSENPKTGLIVAMSVVRTLRSYGETIVVGA
jgi:aspartate dehydrogenase